MGKVREEEEKHGGKIGEGVIARTEREEESSRGGERGKDENSSS